MKKIGIIGSRRRDTLPDYKACCEVFFSLYEEGDIVVSGGCPQGGDKFAELIAKDLGLTEENGKLILHLAKWRVDGKYIRAAGFIRNTYIAEDSDVIIAVVAEDRKGGTEDTIKKAEKMGKTIILVDPLEIEYDPLDEI